MPVLITLLLAALSLLSATADRHAMPSTNPHQASPIDCTCPAQLLDPKHLSIAPHQTQSDTFLSTELAKVANVPVVLYNFRQPARLNHQELPFKIVLMTTVGPGALELVVEEAVARDSWFVGYKWSVLLCTTCQDNMAHIGWKFTSVDGDPSSFYALIVRVKEDEQGRTSVAGRFGEMLRVGQPASAWMTTAALGLLARMDTSKMSL